MNGVREEELDGKRDGYVQIFYLVGLVYQYCSFFIQEVRSFVEVETLRCDEEGSLSFLMRNEDGERWVCVGMSWVYFFC